MTPAPATATPLAADVEQARSDVIQAVNENPDHFGGVLVNQDGSLLILYVGSNAGRQLVEDMIASGLSVQWRQVERSYNDLMQILREISDRNYDGVWALSIDASNNQVEVRVSPDELVPTVASALAPEYGDAVLVVGGPPAVVH